MNYVVTVGIAVFGTLTALAIADSVSRELMHGMMVNGCRTSGILIIVYILCIVK